MRSEFLTTLQTLRFFAALAVAQYHLWENSFGIIIGHPGTDFFLVLVGVVAAYTLAPRIPDSSWWGYIKARYVRLYITYLPIFLIALLAKWAEANLDWVLRSFLFIPIADGPPIIGATWMLSMFVLFYFVFGLAFLAGDERILWFVFGVWTTMIVMDRFSNWHSGLPRHWEELFFSIRNINFIAGYGAGIVLRNGWLQERQARLLMWAGLVGVIGGTVLLNMGVHSAQRMLFVSLPVVLFILGLAALEQQNADNWLVNLLTKPWLVWLGGTSYVIYLSHGMFFQVWDAVLPVSPIWVLPMTVGAIIVGVLGYIFWEHPAIAYVRTRTWRMPRLPGMKKRAK